MNFDLYLFGLAATAFILFLFPIAIFTLLKNVFNKLLKQSNSRQFKSNVITIDKKSLNNNTHSNKYNKHIDITIEDLKNFNTENIDGLKDYLYDIFYRFEQAYNNLDYDTMKVLSTKQVFQNYYTGISLDLKLGRKRIIEDVERKNVIIYEIDSTMAKQSASAMIEISYRNYVVDKNGQIISGFRNTPITEKFEVEFRNYFEFHDVTKCNNCGAIVTGKKCEYCRTSVSEDNFRICSIRKIVEK